ncbi:hypothetical protein [Bacillus cereus]|uniref:Uncharacterized protein n=1 Tax=Bacillus cereus TaxID=1396 RepID=A0AAW5L5A0_BACCE|nr:hypothetical protein [Bacillus cereus]MCQ6288015.1 hypothetical protein [Bacillus cereus]MCQ6317125.1 hypothetical protein [Bacillus cereus]MCQ6329073.1 hypothetical protein [Bacillus cereus]MCQ6385217.1 hypothetical protein [Bacillus cereus]
MKNRNNLAQNKSILISCVYILMLPIYILALNMLQYLILIFFDLDYNSGFSLILSLGISIFIFGWFIKKGFSYFSGEDTIHRIISIIFGLSAYICLLLQIGIIFLGYYYVQYSDTIFSQEKVLLLEDMFNGQQPIDLLFIIRILFNNIFPLFFKYPDKEGIMVGIQFFMGKFIDIFILAFIVEKLKRK